LAYLVLSYLVFVIRLKIQVVYAILVFALVNAAVHAYVKGPLHTAAVHKAENVCRDETERLNLRAGHGSSIRLVFHYRKRFCGHCEGYEFDRNENQRYHEIYVEVTVRGPEAVAVDYGEATATVVDEYFHQTDLANAPIATATEISTEAYREGAPSEPYVTPPMASAQFVTADEAEQEAEPPPKI